MKISKIITDKYKLRIPPTVYYDLLADVVEAEEEQQPTPKNDLGVDAVSRDAVLDLIADYDLSMGQVVKGIHALPSVTPQEPKKGEWCPQNDDYSDWYECSECGYGSEGEMQYSSEYDVRTNYCPNCGARMVEPQESEIEDGQ